MSLKPALLFGLALLLLNGCAAYRNMTRQEDCDKVLKAYSRMLRWNEMEKAALLYVDQQQQETYSRNAEALRRRSITMADMRVLAGECRSDRKTAESTVEFDYFILPDNRLKTVTDRQKWVFREENQKEPGVNEGWRLVSPLPDFR